MPFSRHDIIDLFSVLRMKLSNLPVLVLNGRSAARCSVGSVTVAGRETLKSLCVASVDGMSVREMTHDVSV